MKKLVYALSGLLVFLLGFTAVYAAANVAANVAIEIGPGDQVTVNCGGEALQITEYNPVSALLVCAANATATPAPTNTPTPAPEPTPTDDHGHHGDAADLRWHAPGAHGDRPPHEHGDAVPQWVLDAGYDPVYSHAGMTPGENHPYWKHTGFKGWAGRFNNQDWYGIFHLDFNPGGHANRFHSYQLWIRSDSGAVSHFHGWLDFGQGNQTGPNLISECGGDAGVRPIISVNEVGCPLGFESWYAAAGANGRAPYWPDLGFNINANYYTGGDPANPATWTSINPWPMNAERRIEFAWYADRSDVRGEFWTTQFGDRVDGPNAAVCGTQRSYGDRAYTVVCLRQYIAQDLRTIGFPGNAIQRTFPDPGVELPN